jgi:exosortase family protein XrtF
MTQLLQKIRSANAFTLFIVKAFLFYMAWWLLYNMVIAPRNTVDDIVIANQVKLSGKALRVLGYKVEYSASANSTSEDILWIDGSVKSLQVEKACDSIDLMGLFAVFILAYPGSWKNRLWYIPCGILLIHLLNIVRIISLTLIQYHSPDMLDFNHKYTFTALMYLFIFSLWYLWVKRFSLKH